MAHSVRNQLILILKDFTDAADIRQADSALPTPTIILDDCTRAFLANEHARTWESNGFWKGTPRSPVSAMHDDEGEDFNVRML
jgi:hypothetical protein